MEAVNITLTFQNEADLIQQFRTVGVQIPDRTQKRKPEVVELWCLRRYMLPQAPSFNYPLVVTKGESPDFMVANASNRLTGLEVTLGTTEEYQRESTKAARAGQSVVSLPSRFAGWAGNSFVSEWSSLMYGRVVEKTEKLQDYREASRYELVIWDDNEIPVTGDEINLAIGCLRHELTSNPIVVRQDRQFAVVSIVRDALLAYDVMSNPKLFQL